MKNNNHGMIRYKDYVAGWLDSSIHEFLEYFPSSSSQMDFALITCLDSNLDPRSLLGKSPELKDVRHEARAIKSGILLPTARMLEAISSNQIFFGFDELWFFPHDKFHQSPHRHGWWVPNESTK